MAPEDNWHDYQATSRVATSGQLVRQAGTGSAIGAGFLLYFGFIYLAEPAGSSLWDRAAVVFYHTLRIGGITMAVVTLWLWTGHRPSLLLDGLVCSIIGLLMIGTGVGLLVGGGDFLQPLINGVCGGMFLSSGVRNTKLFLQLRTVFGNTAAKSGDAGRQDAATGVYPTSIGSEMSESHSLHPVDEPLRRDALVRNHQPEVNRGSTAVPNTSDSASSKDHPSDAPPPGGFLAAFGKEDP